MQTHVKGQLDKGFYKVLLLSCSSGVHTQRLMDERGIISDERNVGHDMNLREFLDITIINAVRNIVESILRINNRYLRVSLK